MTGWMKNPERAGLPLVGRSEEMQVLHQVLREVKTRHSGQLIFLSGEAGVGKSRLVKEFTRQIQDDTTTIFSGECLSNQPRVSYWVFLDLLRNSLLVTEETPIAITKQKLEQKTSEILGGQADETIPYLEHLLSLPVPDPALNRRIIFLDPDRLHQKIFFAVKEYLSGFARQQPLILILEDLLEADEPSLDLLISLLDMLVDMPVLMIAISRPFLQGPLKRVRDAATQKLGSSVRNLYLPHLDLAEGQAVLEKFLGTNGLSDRMRDRIVEKSQGVPFYLEEIVRMLIDLGILRRTDAQWGIKETVDLANLGVPETLQSLVLTRFELLDRISKQALQAAAVIGRFFHRKVLDHVLSPLSTAQIDLAVKSLVDRGFLYGGDGVNSNIGEFSHNLSAEIVYKTLSESEIARLHGRVGHALEAFYADQISTQIDLLARHFGLSDQKNSALNYLYLAGKKAARGHINIQARNYFEDALVLLSEVEHEPVLALAVYMGLGDVLFLVGEYLNARNHYDCALNSLGDEPGLKFLGQICTLNRKIGATFERLGDYDQALAFLNKAKELVEDRARPFPDEKSQVLNDMGWIHFRLGNFPEAEQELIQALSLAQQAGRYDITASIYNRLGGIYWQKDDLEKATNFVQKSLALRQEIGDTLAVARSYNNLGLLDWKRGKWESALNNFEYCLKLHANLGDIEGIIDVQGNLGLLQLDRGEVEAAESHLKESLVKARQIGHNYIIAMTLMYFSRLHVILENWQVGLDFARQSQKIFDEIGARDELVDVFTLVATAYLGLGSLQEAEFWAERAGELLPKDEQGGFSVRTDEGGRALRLMGEICRLQGEFKQADRLLLTSAYLFNRMGNSLEEARTMISQARLSAELDDQTGARVILNEARLIFHQLGAKLDLQKVDILASEIKFMFRMSNIPLT